MTWKRITNAHKEGDHDQCQLHDCDIVSETIEEAHRDSGGPKDPTAIYGLHSKYCRPETCIDVAQSHLKDHKLCNRQYCSIVLNEHDNNNHNLCNWWNCSMVGELFLHHAVYKRHSPFCKTHQQKCEELTNQNRNAEKEFWKILDEASE